MPLLAIDTLNQNVVVDLTLVDNDLWASIWRQRTGGRLKCRSCGQPVHAKRRAASGMRFFAHTSIVTDCPTAGESARHLQLKADFAAAFRAAGWLATLEVAGDGWRADVLATDGTRQIAVEVQLSPIDADTVAERTRRHRVSGVQTLWVIESTGPPWTQTMPTVFVGDDNRVEHTVVVPPTGLGLRPHLAAPASIDRFVQRLVDGRLTVIGPTQGLWRAAALGAAEARLFQLDGCVDCFVVSALVEHERAESARRAKEAIAAAERERLEADRAASRSMMEASLQAFVDWFEDSGRAHGFTGKRLSLPELAVDSEWDPAFGILIMIGWIEPTHLLAIAEPRSVSPRMDRRVLAWTARLDPTTVTEGFARVLTPSSHLDEVPGYGELKRFHPRRRRWR